MQHYLSERSLQIDNNEKYIKGPVTSFIYRIYLLGSDDSTNCTKYNVMIV